MKIEGFIWYRDVIDKLLQKHQVTDDEVEEVLPINLNLLLSRKAESKKRIYTQPEGKPILVATYQYYSYTKRPKRR